MYTITWIGAEEEVTTPAVGQLIFNKGVAKEVSKQQYCLLMALNEDLTSNPFKRANPNLIGEIKFEKRKEAK